MRWIGRWIFNAAAAISLVLCVAVVALWVRSHWVVDRLNYSGYLRDVACASNRGRFIFLVGEHYQAHPAYGGQYTRETIFDPGFSTGVSIRERPLAWMGFFFSGRIAGPLGTGYLLILPDWLLCLALLVPPARWVWGWRRDRLQRDGHCAKCGYDLAGNTSGICPECGTPIVSSVGAASRTVS